MKKKENVIQSITSRTLNNGFKVIIAPNKAHPIVSLQLYVKVGSCWENDNEAGYSHFLEHLVFKSTKKYPNNSLSSRATYLGSNLNAYTEFDSTCFYLTLSSQCMKEGLDILSQLCRFANFSHQDFVYEKNVVLEEIAYYQNDPEDFFIEQIPQSYLIESPFKKPILGSRESIKNSTYKELNQFMFNNYTANNSFLVVSGDFEENNLLDEVDNLFSDWGRGKSKPNKLQKTIYPKSAVVESINGKVSKPLLAFSIPELSNNVLESHTLDIISRIFANGKKSRLHKRLFIEEKLTDEIRVESFSGIYNGITIITINPKRSKDIDNIITAFYDEFKQIHYIENKELNDTKSEMIYAHRYALEYVNSIAFSLGSEEILGSYENFKNYYDLINNINSQDISNMLKSCYNENKLGIFSLTSNLTNDRLKNIVEDSYSSLQKRYNNENFVYNVNESNDSPKDSSFLNVTLSNGTKMMLKKVEGKPTIGITAAFKTSQLLESIEDRGINYLTSILLLYGNDKMSYEQILEYCSQFGIQLSISPSDEITLIRVKCFSESLNSSLQLIADIISSPVFKQEHFLNIQQTIISNLERIKDNPSQYATFLWKKLMFGNDSNLLDREGVKSTVKKISRKKIVKWFNNHFIASQMSLSIVGDIHFDNVISYCNRLFTVGDKLLKSPIEDSWNEIIKPVTKSKQQYRRSVSPVNNGAIIHVGGFCCSSKETEKNTAFRLLSQIMGGDINSRLFDELREKRGLAYTVGFAANTMQHLGYFTSYAIVDRKNARQTIDLLVRCFNDLIHEGITKDELITAKNSIRGQRLRTEESVSTQASALATLDCLGYDYDYYLKRDLRLQSVTVEDIQNIAREYLQKELLYIHLLL